MTSQEILSRFKITDSRDLGVAVYHSGPSAADQRPLFETSDCLVAFDGRSSIRWLRLLKSGFRHCFCAVAIEGSWVIVDPLKQNLAFAVVPECTANRLAVHYQGLGMRVLLGFREPAPHHRPMVPAPFTCVELVKRALGVVSPRIITPFMLFCHLKEKHGFREVR